MKLCPTTLSKPYAPISIDIARSLEDLMQSVSIRSRVYLQDQDCPWGEEFDQNDLCGIHLVAKVEGEPAGTLRLRHFASFVKLERLAVLKQFRRKGLATKMVAEALRIAAGKGFLAIYIHAQVDAIPFWDSLGFERVEDREDFMFSGHRYHEMLLKLKPGNILNLQANPMVLNRPEGSWDVPGPMEGGAGGMDFAAND